MKDGQIAPPNKYYYRFSNFSSLFPELCSKGAGIGRRQGNVKVDVYSPRRDLPEVTVTYCL